MNPKMIAPLFYTGTLISSIGSFAFNLALIAFMLQSGFHLGHASLIIGLQRLVPVIVTGVWGHFTDNLPARMTVIVAEVIAAVSSIVLLAIWSDGSTNYALLATVCVVRAVVVSFQMGSRAKITKLLSDGTYAGNSKHAIWFNKATQGATLFGGLCGWVIIRHFNFQTAIIFDALTFLLNGFVVFLIPDLDGESQKTTECSVSWREKFRELFEYNKRAATLDIVLAVSMMGTVAFMSRMAGHDQSWTALYMASFGLAVWVAGFLERSISNKISSFPFWLVLGVSFTVLGQLKTPSVLTLLVFFIKDLSYWTILHRISSHIQMDTPAARTGSVFSARMSIMITILASGEAMVGAWSSFVPIEMEGIVRGFIGIGMGLYLLTAMSARKAVLDDRPTL